MNKRRTGVIYFTLFKLYESRHIHFVSLHRFFKCGTKMTYTYTVPLTFMKNCVDLQRLFFSIFVKTFLFSWKICPSHKLNAFFKSFSLFFWQSVWTLGLIHVLLVFYIGNYDAGEVGPQFSLEFRTF